jgi:VIT1/CCC1 family predicted Fe2+/Mn2+ transporter
MYDLGWATKIMQVYIERFRQHLVEYIGFVALGLADAIVEVTGVHAGFLGVAGSTIIAGIAGLIVGFAAGISMGSAAYIQSKQDPRKSPIASAFTTGISYMVCAIFLALPYFFIGTMIAAFTASTLIGIVLLGAFTFYGTRGSERKFLREFTETTVLLLITALATYLLGIIVSDVFHIHANNF